MYVRAGSSFNFFDAALKLPLNKLIFGLKKLGLDTKKDTKHCSCVLNPFVPTLVAAVSLISIDFVVLPVQMFMLFTNPRK